MSREGVTQGNPLAMAFYAIATTPLIEKLRQDTLQVWYADDAAGAGKLSRLRAWWDKINELGPAFRYFPNATKSHILVKENLLREARDTFEALNLQIVTNGMGYLGGSIGSEQFTKDFIASRVQEWIRNVEDLFEMAQCHPQAALAVLTRGLVGKWTYLMRVTSGDKDSWNQLEAALQHKFLPALTGRQAFSDAEREVLSLPAKLDGIRVIDPSKVCSSPHEVSRKVSAPLISSIQSPVNEDAEQVHAAQKQIRAEVHQTNRKKITSHAKEVRGSLPQNRQAAIEQSCEDGASSWITAIPVTDFGFNLHKQAFRDALCLRYGLPLSRLPSHCVCGVPFSIDHAFTCPKGVFSIIRHNRIRDLLADLLTEVCLCVAVEPVLQPLSGEQFQLRSTNVVDNARLDVSAHEFWDKRRTTAFLMSRCSVPMLPPTAPPRLPHVIVSMNLRKEGNMREE